VVVFLVGGLVRDQTASDMFVTPLHCAHATHTHTKTRMIHPNRAAPDAEVRLDDVLPLGRRVAQEVQHRQLDGVLADGLGGGGWVGWIGWVLDRRGGWVLQQGVGYLNLYYPAILLKKALDPPQTPWLH
jgi:hypothetical protein